jgi:hypothetical protein
VSVAAPVLGSRADARATAIAIRFHCRFMTLRARSATPRRLRPIGTRLAYFQQAIVGDRAIAAGSGGFQVRTVQPVKRLCAA